MADPESPLHPVGPLLLDVTRLVTRIGRGPLTGIDRVELAYLSEALRCEAQFLVRSTRGYLLLGPEGGRRLADSARQARPLGRADLVSTLMGRGGRPRHQVEGDLRRLALDSANRARLPALLRLRVPSAVTYFNVGHANLETRSLAALATHGAARRVVMVHDLIPLTHPEYVADNTPDRMRGRFERVQRYADLVICNSAATQAEVQAAWRPALPAPPTVIAHLGVEAKIQPRGPRDQKQFLMLGTIEPRKGHSLMLDTWETLAEDISAADMPQLHIIGAIGWKSAPFLERLRSHPLFGRSVHLHGALPDAAVQDRLARASALLFPSFAEGFGYPPLEAAAAGAVPICSDLPVFRETLGDCGVYVEQQNPYAWGATIKKHIQDKDVARHLTGLRLPNWPSHFATVSAALATHRAEGT